MSKKQTSTILDIFRSHYTFLLVDPQLKIMEMSTNYAQLFGIDEVESIGHSIKDELPMLNFEQVLTSNHAVENLFIPYFNYKKNTSCTMICSYIPIIFDDQLVAILHKVIHSDTRQLEQLHTQISSSKPMSTSKKEVEPSKESSRKNLNQVLGTSKPMKELKELVAKVANSNLSILITGETGTGKEVFANAIHQLSNRCEQPFVKINCAAIPKDLLESELFGYAEGAFSGALKGGKMGRFELANNGTILLDEIGEMPLPLQAKLLRVIQEQELVRVGGLKTIKLNVRIICNTNKNLEEMVSNGKFREDLYYRINVVELPLPPLREHLEDIPALCEHFIQKANTNHSLHITGAHPDVYPFLQHYHWKGNVRELEHTMERACVMCNEGQLQIEHFDFLLPRIKKNNALLESLSPHPTTLKSKKNEYEKEEIIKALSITKGNKSAAAKYLQISRSVFYTKLKNYDLL